MNLTQTPEMVTLPICHYLFVEKIGPFQDTARACWEEAHKAMMAHPEFKKVGAMALFKMKPEMIYRAGFVLAEKPEVVPAGVVYIKFEGGRYAKYTLTGPYMNLGPAWGQTMQNMEKQKLSVRDDFFLENYVNDPIVTPEDQLISELMIPTK